MKVRVICAQCRKPTHKEAGLVNRAKATGASLFCDRWCFGASRRKGKTKAQKVAEKRLYDMAYRAKNLERIKADKRAHFQRTYDPRKAAVERKKRMHLHVAYCRQPRYKEWKRDYDKVYRAKGDFGPFWEAALLVSQLDEEIASRISRYDIYLINGTINKALQRRRAYESQHENNPVRR